VVVTGIGSGHKPIKNNDIEQTFQHEEKIARSVSDSYLRPLTRKGLPIYRDENQAQYDKAITHKHTQTLAHKADRQSQENSLETEISALNKGSTDMIPITPIKRTNKDKARRIMIVDDEQDVTFLFKIILESVECCNDACSCKVNSFTDSMTALENFREGQYDLIIIDIVMPKMDGFKLYKEIRKQDKIVKICFLTAGEMYYEEYRKHAFPEISADRIIRKPISNEDLVRKVNSLFDI
jgi:CheY-like chemotaxis protein